jgi:hypothetical protein
LKTPYREGTTHIVLELLDFIARLAALRAAITPGGRGSGSSKHAVATAEPPSPKDIRLNWARRLKRVFGIEIEQCVRCGGDLKVIASIEEPELIERILAHRRERGEEAASTASLGARAPRVGGLDTIALMRRCRRRRQAVQNYYPLSASADQSSMCTPTLPRVIRLHRQAQTESGKDGG